MAFEITVPPTPKAITLELLAEISDDTLESVLLNYVLDVQEHRREACETFPPGLVAHYATFVVDGEVLNGGFNQLFFNSPEIAMNAPEAFEYLGMTAAASLMARASEHYQRIQETHRVARVEGTIEAFMNTYEDPVFEDLDRLYVDGAERWRAERIAYIRAHPSDFVHK